MMMQIQKKEKKKTKRKSYVQKKKAKIQELSKPNEFDRDLQNILSKIDENRKGRFYKKMVEEDRRWVVDVNVMQVRANNL